MDSFLKCIILASMVSHSFTSSRKSQPEDRSVASFGLKGHHVFYNSTVFHESTNSLLIDSVIEDEHIDSTITVIQHGNLEGGETFKWVQFKKFNFTFFGRKIDTVGISKQGYVSMSSPDEGGTAKDMGHEYIAPLSAGFIKGNVSFREVSTTDAPPTYHFEIIWKGMNGRKGGDCSFAALLNQSGEVTFMYQKIDESIFQAVNEINKGIPIVVGLADVLIPTSVGGNRYSLPHHKIDFARHVKEGLGSKLQNEIQSGSVILWSPIGTCQQKSNTTCQECVTLSKQDVAGTCYWCPDLNMCSTGVDRQLFEWQRGQCHKNARNVCHSRRGVDETVEDEDYSTEEEDQDYVVDKEKDDSSSSEEQSSEESEESSEEHGSEESTEKGDSEVKFLPIIKENHDYYMVSYSNQASAYDKHYTELNLKDGAIKSWHLSDKSKGAGVFVFHKMNFYFYGHRLRRLFMTTEGFLSLARFLHPGMGKLQFIAPLRLNFDFSVSKKSQILWKETEDKATIEWRDVPLENRTGDGEFTFQVNLYPNDDISFVYTKIPPNLNLTQTMLEELKPNEVLSTRVGTSDAFETEGYLEEYHRIHVIIDRVRSGTVIYLKALPTCHRMDDSAPYSFKSATPSDLCRTCLDRSRVSRFNCAWCAEAGRCSSGTDRLRDDWDKKNCSLINTTESSSCSGMDELQFEFYSAKFTSDSYSNAFFQSDKFIDITGDYARVPLSFDFPYFDTHIHQIYVNRTKMMMRVEPHDRSSYHYSSRRKFSSSIAPFHTLANLYDNIASYYRDDSKIVVQWKSLAWIPLVQATLHSSGKIEFAYNYGAINMFFPIQLSESNTKIFISDMSKEPEFYDLFKPGVEPGSSAHVSYDVTSQFRPALMWPFNANDTAGIITYQIKQHCAMQDTCTKCLAFSENCLWCPELNGCSGKGQDWKRSEWLANKCDQNHVNSAQMCPKADDGYTPPMSYISNHKWYTSEFLQEKIDTSRYLAPLGASKEFSLPFDFPFFGLPMENVIVSEQGFIYFDAINNRYQSRRTQYVAVAMTNSFVKGRDFYVDNDHLDRCTIRWNVEAKGQLELGQFRFQVSLYPNGTIYMEYLDIPYKLTFINDTVTVGLRDSVAENDHRTMGGKRIFRDLNVNDRIGEIKNGTVIVFRPLASCPDLKTCWECTTNARDNTCYWSVSLKRCWERYDDRVFTNSKWVNVNSKGVVQWGEQLKCEPEIVTSHHKYYKRFSSKNQPKEVAASLINMSLPNVTLDKFPAEYKIPFDSFWFFGERFKLSDNARIAVFKEGFLLVQSDSIDAVAAIFPLKANVHENGTDASVKYIVEEDHAIHLVWTPAKNNVRFSASIFSNSSVVFGYQKVDEVELRTGDVDYVVGMSMAEKGSAHENTRPTVEDRMVLDNAKTISEGDIIRFDPIPCNATKGVINYCYSPLRLTKKTKQSSTTTTWIIVIVTFTIVAVIVLIVYKYHKTFSRSISEASVKVRAEWNARRGVNLLQNATT